MLIKVCGMREAENIRAVEKADADWMGFIFYPRSPRFVAERPSYLPQHCKRVGVFVNADPSDILSKAKDFNLDFIQLHGNETPEQCRTLQEQGLHIIRAFQLATPQDVAATSSFAPFCEYFLFDTPTNAFGGSGRSFDWSILQTYQGATPFLLSGGIGPTSLNALKTFHHPLCAGVDLNSRFETKPGWKDAEALHTFISALRTQSL